MFSFVAQPAAHVQQASAWAGITVPAYGEFDLVESNGTAHHVINGRLVLLDEQMREEYSYCWYDPGLWAGIGDWTCVFYYGWLGETVLVSYYGDSTVLISYRSDLYTIQNVSWQQVA